MTKMSSSKAFVLMPFEGEFDAVYEAQIRPALEDASYVVQRADSLLDQRNVLRDVVEGISGADLVIAELTGLNTNVLYEVGLAHGLGIPVVLLTQELEEVPFDLRGYRIQVYSTRFDEIGKLRESLTSIARSHAEGTLSFGSPVTDFAQDGGASPEPTTTETAGDVESATAGFLDRLASLEESATQLGEISERLSEATVDVGEDMNRVSGRMDALEMSRPGAAVQARKLASMAASDLTRYAERVETELPALATVVDSLVDSGLGHVKWLLESDDPDIRGQVVDAREGMAELLEGSTGALEGVQEFRQSMTGVTGVTRELDRATRRVSSALGEVIVLFERTQAFAENSVSLIDNATAAPPDSATAGAPDPE